MARIVLACWGSYGDLFPYLAIANELKTRGHTPVLCTCAYYQPIVEQEGLAFRPLRPDVRPDDTALLARVMDPQRGSEVIIRELIVATLEHFDGNKRRAAQVLGCSLKTLYNKLNAYARETAWAQQN